MALTRGKAFLDSQEAEAIKQKFQQMTLDDSYNTPSTYSPDTLKYPDNRIPFTDKHMNYLNVHPKLDAGMYLANVKLGCRIR
jgi:hypothetical protein